MTQEFLYACVIATIFLLIFDYRQTIDIKNHPGMYEINPILGKHPSDIKITIYFILATLFYSFLALKVLVAPILYFWLGGWAAMEIWAIQNNIKLGLKIF